MVRKCLYKKYLILFFLKEFCCSSCYFDNYHKGHKLIKIEDEESLKKENISIDTSKKVFEEMLTKTQCLKNKIESEISKINELYDKVMKEITQYFEKKHEKLISEENNLKEELQIEVTKVKEKLEIFLSESNDMIRKGNKINKGIDKLEKEKEVNIIKVISYISQLNKNKKEMDNLFKPLIKNMNMTFLENENKIKYDDYYFSGIQIPKDIEFKNIDNNSAEVFWKIDEIKIENINNNEIKFRIEIKKDIVEDEFISVYEGKNKNYKISNLEKNKNYQIRINCFFNNLNGNWSDIVKFKTNDKTVNSIILKESGRQDEFLQKIYEWCGYKNMELLYRGTKDGATANIFHEKCDNQGPTICLYKNNKGNIFGGYASISWENSGSGKPAPGSFLFSLTNIYTTQPTKFNLKADKVGVYHHAREGPVFGSNDIYIDYNFLEKSNITDFPDNFEDKLLKGKSIFTGNPNNNNSKLDIKEIEVFKLQN